MHEMRIGKRWKETHDTPNRPDSTVRCEKLANIHAERMIYISNRFDSWACDNEDYRRLLYYRSLYDKDIRNMDLMRAQIFLLLDIHFQRSTMPMIASLLRLLIIFFAISVSIVREEAKVTSLTADDWCWATLIQIAIKVDAAGHFEARHATIAVATRELCGLVVLSVDLNDLAP